MNEEQKKLRPVGFGRVLVKGFRNAYDSLGYIVFATLAVFLASSALASAAVYASRMMRPGMVGIMLMFLPAVFVAYLGAVGVFYYANKLIFNEHPHPKDTLTGIRVLLIPAAKLFFIDLLISVVLLGDTMFFLGASSRSGSTFTVLGILCAYVFVVWLMMAMYHLPLLVAQLNMESGPRPGVIMRKSFLLIADNPVFTVGLFIAIIALTVLCALPAFIGFALIYLGAAAFILTTALRELFIKYEIIEDEPEVVQDAWSLPNSWLKREKQEDNNSRVGGRSDG